MSTIVVCLDCPHYRKGGFCPKKNQLIGALDPACELAEKTEEELAPNPDYKVCKRCGRELPKTAFSKNARQYDGLQSTCKECARLAWNNWNKTQKKLTKKKDEDMEDNVTTPDSKRCSKCGETKPLDEFGRHSKNKDGKQKWCKACMNKATSRAHANRSKKTAAAKTQPETVKEKATPQANPLRKMTDHALVIELRARGWEVSCTRTITETL